MKKVFNQIINSKFVKNVIIMALGFTGAQTLNILLSPVITRLYGPEAFGIMSTFNAFTQIFVSVAALTYPIAIVLPKNDHDARSLINLSIYISLFIAIISTVIVFIFEENIVNMFKINEIAPFLYYLIPIVIIFAGIMQSLEQWLIRKKKFLINARVTFLQSLITNSSKIGIGLFYPTATVLVFLQAFSNGLKAFMMMLFVKDWRKKNSTNKEYLEIKQLAKKYIDFPLYRAPEVFIYSVSQNIPVLLISSLFGPASAGFYNIGRTVLGLPSNLIGQAIGDVFYSRVSEAANNNEDLNYIIKKATITLFLIGLLPFGLVILFGPFLFEVVFDKEWFTAGEYARWIALSSYAVFINKPSVRALPVLRAQRFQLVFTILILIGQVISLSIGFFVFKNDIIALALFGTTGALFNIILVLITLNKSKKLIRI